MDDLTIILDRDEIIALHALAGTSQPPERVAHEVLRAGLAERLDQAGLPWPQRDGSTSGPAAPASDSRRRKPIVRSVVVGVVAVAAIVTVAGGYLGGWTWTGFRANNQLWDWLTLLLLPVAFATIPVWLRNPEYFDRTKRILHAALALGFIAFVVVGYTMPLGWTGFTGNRLWDWLVLLLLPATLVTVTTWSSTSRTIRRRHIIALAVLAAGWLLTVIGGYVWGWTWTGYQGNTLWDWLQLLLLPLVVPTILAPAAADFLSRPRGGRRQRPTA